MKFKEILGRFTGFSIPVFGVSWNPPEPDVQRARRVISMLEDRRVLYNPYELEVRDHCVQSIIEIRHLLSAELADLHAPNELAQSLRAMRAACRKFLDQVGMGEESGPHVSFRRSHYPTFHFDSALGELRGVFGMHLAKIATAYGLDIEDDLAKILPAGISDGAA
jgi:hypothetical protein